MPSNHRIRFGSRTKGKERKGKERAVKGFSADNVPYSGVLYAGLMLTKDGPKTLEYNCRFGDPETQVILPLLESDLFDVMVACATNQLDQVNLRWKTNLSAVGVILASAGYPETSTKGCEISGKLQVGEKYLPTILSIFQNSVSKGLELIKFSLVVFGAPFTN